MQPFEVTSAEVAIICLENPMKGLTGILCHSVWLGATLCKATSCKMLAPEICKKHVGILWATDYGHFSIPPKALFLANPCFR